MITPKEKSDRRFDLINTLVDEVIGNLPTPSHRVVLLVCWRHANVTGAFRISARRLAEQAGISKRRAQAVLDDLTSLGLVRVIKKEIGTIPKTYRLTKPPT